MNKIHVCIVGTGSGGWIACNLLKNLEFIDKITIIGSPKIPPIGVGESNTLLFTNLFLGKLLSDGDFTVDEFIVEVDATIKYGVFYKNWSKNSFIHHFKPSDNSVEINYNHYGRLLANKDPNIPIHDLMDHEYFNTLNENKVFRGIDGYSRYPYSFHFDAGKFINFLSQNALKSKKVFLLNETVVGGKKVEDEIEFISLSSQNIQVKADYYIFATGDSKLNKEFLEIKYKDLSNILLTNKAAIYPLEYKDKKSQFHPYTVAKTMKNGWRWITPTWSRIGTGYVFSNNHITEENAMVELMEDIGDFTIEPKIVDFSPKYNPKSFYKNYCTIGMAQGFLEPLDAPGLSISIYAIDEIIKYLKTYSDNSNLFNKSNSIQLEYLNDKFEYEYKIWTSFILTQYKTCHRNDTSFWEDHKKVNYDYHNYVIENLDEIIERHEQLMFQHTIAAKDIQWKTSLKGLPYKIPTENFNHMHHFDFIKSSHDHLSQIDSFDYSYH